MASQQSATGHRFKLDTYLTWGDKLWFVVDINYDKTEVCLEDCYTEEQKWIRVKWLKTAREVKPINA